MLPVDLEKRRREGPKGGDSAGLTVDVDPVPVTGEDLAPDDEFLSFGIEADRLQGEVRRSFEHGFDDGALLAGSDHVGRCFRAREERKRVDDQGFSGPCFAGEQVEAFFEFEFEFIDKREISDAEQLEHTWGFICQPATSCNAEADTAYTVSVDDAKNGKFLRTGNRLHARDVSVMKEA